MGMLDKVKFWKGGDDPLDLDAGLPPLEDPGIGDAGTLNLGNDLSQGDPQFDMGQQPNWDIERNLEPMGGNNRSRFQQPMQQSFQQPDNSIQRDLELISSKLDAIKASLDSMDQRLRKVENIAEGGGKPKATKDPWANY